MDLWTRKGLEITGNGHAVPGEGFERRRALQLSWEVAGNLKFISYTADSFWIASSGLFTMCILLF